MIFFFSLYPHYFNITFLILLVFISFLNKSVDFQIKIESNFFVVSSLMIVSEYLKIYLENYYLKYLKLLNFKKSKNQSLILLSLLAAVSLDVGCVSLFFKFVCCVYFFLINVNE